MKILIPTAKEMNTEIPSLEAKPLRPESQAVLNELARYSAQELESFYKISAEKAQEEYDHIQALKMKLRQTIQPCTSLMDSCIVTSNGTISPRRSKIYLEKHLMITSALYGVIPAFEPIAPHRLDFLMKLKVAGKTLKNHWQAAYEESMKGEELIFSLLSSEFETVFPKEIREKMVTFKFMEERDGKLKIHSTISKKARGAFLTALMEDQVTSVEEIKKLSFAGFNYREDLSSDKELAFVK